MQVMASPGLRFAARRALPILDGLLIASTATRTALAHYDNVDTPCIRALSCAGCALSIPVFAFR